MKKKYVFSLLLLLFLILLMTWGCGGQKAENPPSNNTTQAVTEMDTDTGKERGETKEENKVEAEETKETVETGSDIKTEKASKDSEKSADKKLPVQGETASNKKTSTLQADQAKEKSTGPLKKLDQQKTPENSVKPVKKNAVTLLVTKDFGAQVITAKKVEIEKDGTVLDLLEANMKIETDYDGGFIKGINGLKTDKGGLSGKRTDWFFYVNGVCADMGADAYHLQGGEVVWWDYHLWHGMGSANPAVIGSYPQPFIHGYGGQAGATTVMYTPDKKALGEKMKKALTTQGVKTVSIKEIDENVLKKRKGPVLVLGEWQELNQIKWLQDFNNAYRKTGSSVHFTDQGLDLLLYNGEAGRRVSGSTGVLLATGSGLGDKAPLWIMSGTDEKGLEEAVNLLASEPNKISGMYSAAIKAGKVVRLPLLSD